jgi:molybdopterin-guanine dinucleotide biosynthesis protein A
VLAPLVVGGGDHLGVGVAIAAIVAGGQGRRLGGRAKALLEVGGRRIVDRQLAVLGPLFSRVVLVASEPGLFADLGLPVIPDRVPGAGPLAGIDAALAALRPGEDALVCVAGDMPFLAAPALTLVRDHAPGAAAVAARVGGRPEPLFARYGRACAAPLQEALATGRLAAAAFLEAMGATFLDEPTLRAADPTLRSLINVNTPDDLARAERLAAV